MVCAFELVTNDSPVVIVEIRNAGDAPYRLRDAVYVSDGTRVTSAPSRGGLIVPAGATKRAALVFGTAPFGGSLTLEGSAAGDRFELSLPLTP